MSGASELRPARAANDLIRLALDVDPLGLKREPVPLDALRYAVTRTYDAMRPVDRRKLIALLAWHARAFALALPVDCRDQILAELREIAALEDAQ